MKFTDENGKKWEPANGTSATVYAGEYLTIVPEKPDPLTDLDAEIKKIYNGLDTGKCRWYCDIARATVAATLKILEQKK